MERAAYVNPHEYKNASYFCSYIVIWVVSQEKEALDVSLHFFYQQLGSGLIALNVANLK